MIKSSNIILKLMTTALLCLIPAAAFSQQVPPGTQNTGKMGYDNPPGMGKRLSPAEQEQLRKRVETLRIWRLTETLKLDSETSAKLASFLSSYDRQRGDLFRERHETMQALRIAIKARKPEDAKLQPLLEKIVANHRATQELVEQEWKSMRDILTTEQQAHFIIFQQDFRRDIQRMLSTARSDAQGKNAGSFDGRDQRPGMGEAPNK
jgi:Spy/CpxP family protein refolding chaperone